MTISFNEQAIKKMSKADFLKKYKSFANLIDLEAYYDRINPKKKVVKKKAK